MHLHLPPRNRTFGFVDALGVTGAVGLAIARWVPVARIVPFWGCVLREQTGWPCLGCGLTRAADRFAHGDFIGALQANPLGAVAAAFFALCVVASALHLAFGVPLPEVRLSPREARGARWALVVAVVLNYAFVVVQTRFPHLLA
ncbi:MAG: DUF2752 domain-containing protein [Myxococcaceae bacterium]|nr:DUF2752 domain-containing protein [Myxococcaceae bacterium]